MKTMSTTNTEKISINSLLLLKQIKNMSDYVWNYEENELKKWVKDTVMIRGSAVKSQLQLFKMADTGQK